MRRFAAYPKYKPSGIDWLGDIPEHWDIKRLKYCLTICNGKDYKEIEDPEGKYPVIGSGGQFAFANHYIYNKPSILLGRKGTIDAPLFVTEPFWTVDTMFFTQIHREYEGLFLFYCAKTIPFDYYTTGTVLPSMTQSNLANHFIAAPPLPEQKAIADFLDRETGKIDGLIDKREKLITLLREKRSALISHAVTKGLDPNVKLKPSGIDWLGDIPEHWEVKKITHYAAIFNGDRGVNYPKEDDIVSEGIPFINAGDLIDGKLNKENLKYITTNKYLSMGGAKICPDDIAYCLRGTIGKSALLKCDSGTVASSLCIIRAKEYPYFIFYQLNSAIEEIQRNLYDNGTAQPNLGAEIVANFKFPLPLFSEQKAIADYLDRETAKIDSLIDKEQQIIEKMREYRTTLISAAVTGKIII